MEYGLAALVEYFDSNDSWVVLLDKEERFAVIPEVMFREMVLAAISKCFR